MWSTGLRAPVLLQAPPTEEQLLAELIVIYILVLLMLGLAAAGSVWIYRDARRRGSSAIGWATLWMTGPGIGLPLTLLGIRVGQPATAGLAYITWIVLSIVLVSVVWVATRSHELVFDEAGRPIHPKALEANVLMFVPGQAPPGFRSRTFPAPPPQAGPPPQAPPGGPPGLVPGSVAPPAPQQVKCPNCQTQFEYQRTGVGPMVVQCPRCQLQGTI